MALAILVFVVVSGSVVGGYLALMRLPGMMAGRQLEKRLRDLSQFEGDVPGAASVVLNRAQSSALPGVDRLVGTNAGSWLSTLIEQSGAAISPGP
ncbi:MAG TPA: hypothetical protein VNN99_07085, partial [Vicinamibacterales bacterium]|nr:hypothetical protein [Vicinamibacterales bacterium]